MNLPQETDTLMFREAAETADVVAAQFARNADTIATLAQSLRENPPPFVVTCARGSSDHAATYAKYLFETQLGIVTASASPSVGSVYVAPLQLRGALYIVISQSGKSPDLLRNAEAAKAAGARVVALVNVEDSPLAQLAESEREIEEAAATLGASRWQSVWRVVLPALWPAVLTGFALAFARGVGEYGSVIFIAGNLPNATEIAPLLITIRLEEFDYAGATAIAAAMLLLSFVILLVVNTLQARLLRYQRSSA